MSNPLTALNAAPTLLKFWIQLDNIGLMGFNRRLRYLLCGEDALDKDFFAAAKYKCRKPCSRNTAMCLGRRENTHLLVSCPLFTL
jgi:hypothetical protein